MTTCSSSGLPDHVGNFNFSIDVPIPSDWANIELLRTSVQNCFTAIFSDIDGRHALAMVTGELIENALKYGDWTGADQQRCRLRVSGDGRFAHVSVENPIRAGDDGADEVIQTLGWIRGFPRPLAAYRAKLLEVAAPDHDPSSSKLGLVRI